MAGMVRLPDMVRAGMVRRPEIQHGLVSAAAHAAVLLLLFGGWHERVAVVAPRHLPGTAAGTQLTLLYSPGGAPPAAATALHAPQAIPVRSQAKIAKAVAPSSASPAAPGTGSSGESSLGDGDISIALVQKYPRPEPDLSSLPHGTSGDVVVDIVIDAQGRISEAKLARGLGGTIDQTVLAVIQSQWRYAPATRNGVAIASEQELLFHFERG